MENERADRSKPGRTEDDSTVGGCVSGLIWVLSMLMICCTFPFSLCVCIKQVQVRYMYYNRFHINSYICIRQGKFGFNQTAYLIGI